MAVSATWGGFACLLPAFALCMPVSLPLQRMEHPMHSISGGELRDVTMMGSVWPIAIYWTFVDVGTPPVRVPVAIDTGSYTLNVEGKGCEGCVTTYPNQGYDAGASSTSRPWSRTGSAPESWSNSYLTCDLKHPTRHCNVSGHLYMDKVSIGGLGPVDIVLGTIEKQTSNFDQFKKIDGVMGLRPDPKPSQFTADKFPGRSVFGQLVAAGLCEDIFAMCLHDGRVSTGTMTLGGVDQRLVDGHITYVPNVDYDGRYAGMPSFGVSLSELRVGNTSVKYGDVAFLDSGTNVLLVPTDIYGALRQAICADTALAQCDLLWRGESTWLSEAELDAYPPLALVLEGVELQMSSRDYLLPGCPNAKEGQVSLGIRGGGGIGSKGFIIGDTTLRNYYVVHDVGQRRIGWGKVNKKTCGSLKEEAPGVETALGPLIAVYV